MLEKTDDLTSVEKQQLDLAKRAISPIPDVSERVLFHLHGDEFGVGSELEGADMSDPLEYMEKFLTTRKEKNLDVYNIDDELLDEIRSAMLLSFTMDESKNDIPSPNFLVKAKEKLIKAFKTEKSLLLPGGWIGKPSGHAMYYEIIPQKDGKVNFRIYNLGEGSSYHQRAIINGKLKTAPYMEWKGIDQEKFLDDTFVQIIYEIKKMSENEGVATDYNASDIYQGFREFLGVDSVIPEDIELTKLMKGQRAGTCTYRSLLAFLATRINREDFKRLTIDIQFQSLINRVNNVAMCNQRELRLIQKSHQKLSRKTQKAYHQNLLSKSDLKERTDELSKVKKHIENLQTYQKSSTDLSSKSIKHHYQNPIATIPDNDLTKETLILNQQIKQENQTLLPQPETKYYLQLKQLKNDPRPLNEKLDLVEKICKEALNQHAYQALELGMVEWVLSLPSDPTQLEKMFSQDPDQIKKAITT